MQVYLPPAAPVGRGQSKFKSRSLSRSHLISLSVIPRRSWCPRRASRSPSRPRACALRRAPGPRAPACPPPRRSPTGRRRWPSSAAISCSAKWSSRWGHSTATPPPHPNIGCRNCVVLLVVVSCGSCCYCATYNVILTQNNTKQQSCNCDTLHNSHNQHTSNNDVSTVSVSVMVSSIILVISIMAKIIIGVNWILLVCEHL
jgi:hypothetical protein